MKSRTRSEIRKNAGYSLVTLSKRSGVSITKISRWERHEDRLRDSEMAAVATAILDGLDKIPNFSDKEAIENFLAECCEGPDATLD